ncbi:hypothetical protein M8006_11750 [Halomonas sp. ATCHA]|uniref:Uncharacterized protein n=1 Tax=Halomonas llamarensis TaxID=2945104 RepID=A0ABT0SS34_9GAMM|nr:hypothetical protein [Halomonas llamarensis]
MAILEKLIELMSDRRKQLASQTALEGGKPLKDSLVGIDASAVIINQHTTFRTDGMPYTIADMQIEKLPRPEWSLAIHVY